MNKYRLNIHSLCSFVAQHRTEHQISVLQLYLSTPGQVLLDLKSPTDTLTASTPWCFCVKMAVSSDANHSQLPHDKVSTQTRPNDLTFLEEKQARIEAIDLEKQENELHEEEDSDQDLDALIHELEEADSDHGIDEGKDINVKHVPPRELFQTDTKCGLPNHEVVRRRRKYGLNQLQEEKESLILKFILFFVGPIQFVMEVSSRYHPIHHAGC